MSGWQDKNVRMLFIASTLMWTCNTMYIIDMPLWISSDLGTAGQAGGYPDGHRCRAGDPGDDPGGLLRQTLRKASDDGDVAVAAGVLFYVGADPVPFA